MIDSTTQTLDQDFALNTHTFDTSSNESESAEELIHSGDENEEIGKHDDESTDSELFLSQDTHVNNDKKLPLSPSKTATRKSSMDVFIPSRKLHSDSLSPRLSSAKQKKSFESPLKSIPVNEIRRRAQASPQVKESIRRAKEAFAKSARKEFNTNADLSEISNEQGN